MDYTCNTDVSEFLAGISIVCLAIHAGIVCFMRPKSLSVRFDPIWNSVRSESPPVLVETTVETTEETKEPNAKGFYSYFT